jgi:hypothetical protein
MGLRENAGLNEFYNTMNGLINKQPEREDGGFLCFAEPQNLVLFDINAIIGNKEPLLMNFKWRATWPT